jgi:hypothetical protein
VLLLVSCSDEARRRESASGFRKEQEVILVYTDTGWYASFREMQNAFVHADGNKIKKFFTFPIYSDENIIWALSEAAYNPPLDDKTGEHRQVAFQETDFDRYRTKIFPTQFVEGISKVVVDSLRPGTLLDHELPGNDSLHYSFLASLDSAGNNLQFVLTTRYTTNKGQRPGDEDVELSLVGYSFSILSKKTIRFREVGVGD